MTMKIIFYLQLLIIWIFFFWVYTDYRIDLLRYRLFKLRSDLFEHAELKKISFDDPAYQLTRTMLNGSLRMAHRITALDIFIAYSQYNKFHKNSKSEFSINLEKSLNNLTLEQKKIIFKMHLTLHYYITSHVLHISPILFPVAFIMELGFKLHIFHKHTLANKSNRKKLEPLDSAIYTLGIQTT